MKLDSKLCFNVFIFIVGLAILAVLVQKVGLARWSALLRDADKAGIVLAILVYALSWPVRTLRLRGLIRYAGRGLSARRIFEINIAGFALNAILPAKAGDVAMVGFLKKDGIKTATAAALVFQTRILDALAIVLVTVPSWFWLARKDTPLWMASSFAVCLFLVAVPFGVTWADKKRKISSFLAKAGKRARQPFWGVLLTKLGEAYDAYHGLVRNRSLMLFSVLASVVIWTLEGAACYALVRALGLGLPLQAAILAVALGNVGKGFQVTPGGMGVYEGIVTMVLCASGAPIDAAVTVAVLDHLLKKGFNLALGFYALIRLRGSPREAAQCFS